MDRELIWPLKAFNDLNLLSGLDTKLDEVRKSAFARQKSALSKFTVPTSHDLSILKVISEDGAIVEIRLIRPKIQNKPIPFILWLHGGGFVIGNAAQDDPFATQLSIKTGYAVAIVDYRLAPENPFPKPLQDSVSGLKYLINHADELRLNQEIFFIGGASAGGGIGAAVSIFLRDEKTQFQPRGQILLYPMLDYKNIEQAKNYVGLDWDVWGIRENAFGWSSYLGEFDFDETTICYASPSQLTNFKALPPTLIIVGDLDLFASENIDYARNLMLAGVSCDFRIFSGAYHGFIGLCQEAGVSLQSKEQISLFIEKYGNQDG